MIAHIVLFEPKPSLTVGERRALLESLRHAVATIPGIQLVRIGKIFKIGRVPESKFGSSTYSFAAILEFSDRSALESYYSHQGHDEVRRLFWLSCESTIICDSTLTSIDSLEADEFV